MKFDWRKISNKYVAVHCNTEEKANNLLLWASKRGFKRHESEISYLDDNFYKYHKQNTCYSFYYGFCGSVNRFKESNFKVVSYEDVLIKEDKMVKININGVEFEVGEDKAMELAESLKPKKIWTEEEVLEEIRKENEESGWVADWEYNNKYNHCIYYDDDAKRYGHNYNSTFRHLGVVYSNKETIQKWADILNKQNGVG